MEEDLLGKLTSLAQLDTDAVSVYDEAISHTTDPDVLGQFQLFRSEHAYHASELKKAITKLGGRDTDIDVDFMGKVADWVTALRSRGGTHGALRAMHTAEEYHNRRYRDAIEWDIEDPELSGQLRGFYDDEKRHLDYIESQLAVVSEA